MEEASVSCSSSTLLQGKYEIGRLLGHGTFGKVYFAREIHSRRPVAMKVLIKEKVIKSGMTEQVKREISAMKKVKHPNIVELQEVLASKTKIFLAMEYIRGGELFSKISQSGRLKEETARTFFRQLISAIDFCHSLGVSHRDLKLENLLLDDSGNLKVADFGLSAISDHHFPDGLLHTACGTPAYAAPEILAKKGYDGGKADLWSCGVILYAMLAGFLPFQDRNIVTMYRKIQRGDFSCPRWFSPEARRIISRLLDTNPFTRITVGELKETRWFKIRVPGSLKLADQQPQEKNGESLNAFHIISLSTGLNLSGMFENEGRVMAEEFRFATTESAGAVISRLEEAAGRSVGNVIVKKWETGIWVERGRLLLEAEIFEVSLPVVMVEVKRLRGDAPEYRKFWCDELRPALEGFVS